MTEIRHPSADFTGTDFLGITFTNGRADTFSPSAIAEYRLRGYGIGGNAPTAADSRNVVPVHQGTPPGTKRTNNGVAEVWDQVGLDAKGRNIYGWRPEVNQTGAPLRDASVAPRAGDYLGPTNAGKADPHSPDVVNPEVNGRHA